MAKSNPENLSKEEFAAVHLALQTVPTSTEFSDQSATDEELTAFLEQRLDATRRAQIISMLANNEAVYERWVRCVENIEFFSNENDKNRQQKANDTDSFLDTLKALFGFNRFKVFGGGFAMVAVVVAVVAVFPMLDRQEKGISDLYDTLEPEVIFQWSKNPPVKSLKYAPSRSFFVKPKTIERQVLEIGFRNGAIRLGKDKYAFFSLDIDSLTAGPIEYQKKLSQQEYQALYDIGQLSAMMSLQCALDSDSQGLKKSGDVFVGLVKKLDFLKMDTINDLVSIPDDSNSVQTRMCMFSDSIVHTLLK